MLAEFCDALNDEINVARRNATSAAIPLNNGHKVGQQGNAHQYAFQIDTVLNTPEGAPGDLIVPDHAPLSVTLVSVEGLRIVVSVESDLGQFVPTASLRTDLTFLMRKLVERIKANVGADNPAASRMLGLLPVTGQPQPPLASAVLDLDQNQTLALMSSLGRDLTVIWGPPGTGKTRTIGTISEQLYMSSRSVLIVSHTNTAVDQAIKHAANSMQEHLAAGAVIRVGTVRDKKLSSDFPDVLLKTQVERQSSDLVKEREKLVSQRQAAADRLTLIQRDIAIIEWMPQASLLIQSARNEMVRLNDRKRRLSQEQDEFTVLKRKHQKLLNLHRACSKVLEVRKARCARQEEERIFRSQLRSISQDIADLDALIARQKNRLKLLNRLEPLRVERDSYPTPREQKLTVGTLAERFAQAKESLNQARAGLKAAQSLLREIGDMNALKRMIKRLPSPENQKEMVHSLSRNVNVLESECQAAQAAHDQANSKLARILELDGELSRHDEIGTRQDEEGMLARALRSLKDATNKRKLLEETTVRMASEMEELESEESRQAEGIPGDTKEVYIKTCSQLQRLTRQR